MLMKIKRGDDRMNNEQFIKWSLELCNQEFAGNMRCLMDEMG